MSIYAVVVSSIKRTFLRRRFWQISPAGEVASFQQTKPLENKVREIFRAVFKRIITDTLTQLLQRQCLK